MSNWDKAIERVQKGWCQGKPYRPSLDQACALGAIYSAVYGEDRLKERHLDFAVGGDPFAVHTPEGKSEYSNMVSELARVITERVNKRGRGFDHYLSQHTHEGIVWRYNDGCFNDGRNRDQERIISAMQEAKQRSMIGISATEEIAKEKRGWP